MSHDSFRPMTLAALLLKSKNNMHWGCQLIKMSSRNYITKADFLSTMSAKTQHRMFEQIIFEFNATIPFTNKKNKTMYYRQFNTGHHRQTLRQHPEQLLQLLHFLLPCRLPPFVQESNHFMSSHRRFYHHTIKNPIILSFFINSVPNNS